MQSNASALAAGVRAEMARAGVSARTLATNLAYDRGRIHRRLNGQVAFRADELEAIARHLDVPVSRFYETRASA